MARARNPYKTTLVNFHLPQELADRLDEASKVLHRTKISIAIQAFEDYLERHDGSGAEGSTGVAGNDALGQGGV